jgi:hypothetical protein
MPDMTPAPRRRPLWRLFIMPALLVVAAAAWSAFWFYAASEAGVRADAWAAQEAKSGRVYAAAALGGRLPVPLRGSLRRRQRVAGLADGGRTGAVHRTARRNHGDRADLPAETVDRRIQGAGHAGRSRPAAVDEGELDHRPQQRQRTADIPQRASIVFENPSIDRIDGPVQTPLARAGRAELHGRFAEGSAQDNRVIETVLQISGGSVQEVHPLLAARSMSTLKPG